MSHLSIQSYYAKLDNLLQYSGQHKEIAIRSAFQQLLENYCHTKHFILVTELEYRTKFDTVVRPDGTVKDALRLPWGYWESKDQDDDLDKEIAAKFEKGYPNDNILFEDSKTAVLIQGGQEVMHVNMRDADKLNTLLTQFINYERPEVKDFRQAIEQFKQDLPIILATLRQLLENQAKTNDKFKLAFQELVTVCEKSINPQITHADIREMIIQHILTEDIFIRIFDDAQFHQENPIACELAKVTATFFTHETRRNTLDSIKSYYAVIQQEATRIANHHEKQKFLKVVYENFYRTYNPQAADRLGIFYTPNEIVQFMLESTDFLLNKHFNRLLADKEVEILDPATGTGTFITELLEYLPKHTLTYKYQTEIHCNEVSILPYYIAYLNIEYTYKQKMGEYQEFKHICFVDTLDNLSFDYSYKNKQETFNLGFTQENAKRIQEQNVRKISVIIGNPPYNANQQNENENNKNRSYPEIDEAIKKTYIAQSTAQKTKLYDMYVRFLRWASNRIDKNGMIAFVSNNSFINAKTFDGFRKMVAEEFNEIYVIDLKGNANISGEQRRREGGNVFNDSIKVGIAVYFLIKNKTIQHCKIYYTAIADYISAEEKQAYLKDNKFENLEFTRIYPDKDHNWTNLASNNDFSSLLPIYAKDKHEHAIFEFSSLGINTARDEWVYDFNKKNLQNKIRFFIETYNKLLTKNDISWNTNIKWSEYLKGIFKRRIKISFDNSLIKQTSYRPFVKQFYYAEKLLSDRLTQNHYDIFGKKLDRENIVININMNRQDLRFFASNMISDLHFVGDSTCFPLYRYDNDGNPIDNITDWGLEQFRKNDLYSGHSAINIQKIDIFYYIYAVLHNPAYRQKYEANLKRALPRIPFYPNFWQWAAWGKALIDLHLNYETVTKYPLQRIDLENPPIIQKTKLKANKTAGIMEMGIIEIDSVTTLQGIPPIAWDYKLGNRSALEWILYKYKETTPKDQTITEKFNSYRFTDYKEIVIELLQRVCTVSVETMKIIGEFRKISDYG